MRLFAILISALPLGAAGIAVQDVTVIDVAAGVARPHMTVVIDQGKISRVGAASSVQIPASTRIVAGKDKFLIPGLWDMDVHLYYKQYLPLFIAFGITGVQDTGSDFAKVKAWRDEIEKGASTGPRILTSGPSVDGIPSKDSKGPVLVVHNADQGRQAFDQLYKEDVDFIGILPLLPRGAYFALAELARHWDLRIVGPIPSTVTAQEAVEVRQKSLENMSGIVRSISTDEAAVKFFERCALTGTRISPTLVQWLRLSHMDDPKLMSDPQLTLVPAAIRNAWPDVSKSSDSWKAQIWRAYRLVALAKRAKTEILSGTGTGDPYVIPGAALQDELVQLVEAGLTPRDALEAATLAPARFVEMEKDLGSIDKGKLADLVLLDANPLDDIGNVRQVRGVFARGRYFNRQELDSLLYNQ